MRISAWIRPLAAAVLCVALAGCQSPAPQPEPSASPSAGAQVKMLWWGNAQEEAVLAEQLAALDVDVEVEKVEAAKAEEVIAERIAAGQPPDIVRTTLPHDYAKNAQALHIEWDFVDAAERAATDGQRVIAAPYDAAMTATYINKNAFQKAGVDVPELGHPWRTWAELIADAQQVKNSNQMSASLAISNDPTTVGAFLMSYGTPMFGKNPTHVDFNTGVIEDALEEFYEWAKAGEIANVYPTYHAPDSSASPIATPDGEETAEDVTTTPPQTSALELFEAGEVPVVILPARTPAPAGSVRVDNPCQEICGGLPQASYLSALTEAGASAGVIEALTSKDADEKRAQAAGTLVVHTELIPTVPQEPAGVAGEYARLMPTQMSSGMSPVMSKLTDWPGDELAMLLADEINPKKAAELMRERLQDGVDEVK